MNKCRYEVPKVSIIAIVLEFKSNFYSDQQVIGPKAYPEFRFLQRMGLGWVILALTRIPTLPKFN